MERRLCIVKLGVVNMEISVRRRGGDAHKHLPLPGIYKGILKV